ncbi:hypothetical protein DM02DRAFT_721125 [Periconia macrospinosa]|uniref:Uncharacterized protein n=1 Tax=Periconia macrospinosa TaxID=97972 RepID=A0A2V1DC75_9PLEO|nr:hypothetical protein DM02DRAFT_721125 [Periconia macrospinosa]
MAYPYSQNAKRQRTDNYGIAGECTFAAESIQFEGTLALSNPSTNAVFNDQNTIEDCRPVECHQDNELVCFGLVPSIECKCELHAVQAETFPVHLISSSRFWVSEPSTLVGHIASQHGNMIDGLVSENTLKLFVSCTTETTYTQRNNGAFSLVPCTLDITVYGPMELFDEIGDWFQDYDIFLQDPRTCHLDVRYFNPHRLSSDKSQAGILVSQVIAQASAQVNFQEIYERPDLLDLISGQENLEEAVPSPLLSATLHRHQKQALTFMIRREMGWKPGDTWPDIWETLDNSHGRCYINHITEEYQAAPPRQTYGGIVADPMGLGKTLTMIALAAGDLSMRPSAHPDLTSSHDASSVEATLIIVPQPLLSTWEGQILNHVHTGAIRFRRHHGKTRLGSLEELRTFNIIITTYHTLSADWNAQKDGAGNHIMFEVRWKRIILDEAHLIRNVKTRMSRAIHDLDAVSRWAVTGTPIQNNLSDIAALLKFIRADPYDDSKYFEKDISRLWKSGEDEEAVKRLKRLARCVVLRRAKKTINLPPRRDVKCPVEFHKAERELYESIRHQAILKIDDVLQQEMEFSRSRAYVNCLQQIESMRLVCNLGLRYHTRHDNVASKVSEGWAVTAQKVFNSHRNMHTIVCSQCSLSLDMAESLMDDAIYQDSPLFTRCLKYACSECSHKLRLTGFEMACDHTPRCPVAPVSISTSAMEETFNQSQEKGKGHFQNNGGLPSKVEALLSDLRTLPLGVKSIVFSSWRLTLDIVETGLTKSGIQCVRFDGKVPQTQRQPVLDRFRTDPNVRVMLLTIQCGAVGLTLTEASRAYLMEPHWNPTIEEQALARIHRIGQTQQVTTVRFYIRNSFEERVMEVQESKKNLASVLLSGHDGESVDDSLGALQRLRSLL